MPKFSCYRKEIDQFSLDNKFIKRHSSLAEAASSVNLKSYCGISTAARKGTKSAGYYWKHVEQPDLVDEVWKEHPLYSNLKCSDKGRVMGPSKIKHFGHKREDGYMQTRIGIKSKRVHRLILETFDSVQDHLVVNHIDGVRSNNNIKNLEWLTNVQNSRDAMERRWKKAYPEKPLSQMPMNNKK